MRIHVMAAMGLLLAGGSAEAATCSFDAGTGVLTVNLLGTKAELKANATGILLDGVACGAATQTSTSRIVVNGNGTGDDNLVLRGKFAPGRNDVPETDTPEIEIDLVNGWKERADFLTVFGSVKADDWRVSASGINLNGDLDADLTAPAAGRFVLRPMGGDDVVDASGYTGSSNVRIYGGDGNDSLTGGPNPDWIYGEAGNDRLFGSDGRDFLFDGPGADVVRGNAGNDVVNCDPDFDAGDDFGGGTGKDTVSYISRQPGLTVTLDSLADDGEAGENDYVRPDVEVVDGGSGDDVLVGSSADNTLFGGGSGFDDLYGGGGNDTLLCGISEGCFATGETGNDFLFGSDFDDVLDGGDGDDELHGADGNDSLTGGSGVDLLEGQDGDDVFDNADGFADTVDCGNGIDDPDPDPLDTFTACENI